MLLDAPGHLQLPDDAERLRQYNVRVMQMLDIVSADASKRKALQRPELRDDPKNQKSAIFGSSFPRGVPLAGRCEPRLTPTPPQSAPRLPGPITARTSQSPHGTPSQPFHFHVHLAAGRHDRVLADQSDRKAEHPQRHLADFRGTLQADAMPASTSSTNRASGLKSPAGRMCGASSSIGK
jgi:hypothetical protein